MNRVSTKLKLLRGTARNDRLPQSSAAELLTEAPPPPLRLTPSAREEWRRLAPVAVGLGTLTKADLRTFQLLCEVLASESQLRELLASEGWTVRGADGNMKGHPAARALEAARNQAHRLLDAFGMTPKGRQHVDIKPPKKLGRLASLGAP